MTAPATGAALADRRTPPGPRVPGVATLVGLHARRVLVGAFRIPAVVVQTFVFPVMLLITLEVVFGETMEAAIGDGYIQRIVPLMALSAALFGGLGSAAALIAERRSGLLDRFRTLPGSRAAMLGGRIVADGARTAIGAVLLAAVGHLLGFRFDTGPAGAAGYLLLVVAYGSAFGWVTLAVAARARAVEDLSLLNALYLVMLFLNVGFVPEDAFPGFLQPIVHHMPHSRAVVTLDGIVTGGPIAEPLAWTLAWIVGLTVVFAPLAVRGLRHR